MAPKWDVMGDPESWSVPAFRPGPCHYYTEDDVLYDGQVAKRAVEYLDGFGKKKEEPFF
jgi:hypothetical protein